MAATLAVGTACQPAPTGEDPPVYEGDRTLPGCVGNNDGTIEASELPFVPNVVARYRIAEGAIPVDVKGRVEGDGPRVWDFSEPDPSEQPLAELVARAPGGFWFDGSFAGVDVMGPLAPDGSLLGALDVDDDGVHLLGAASAEEDPEEGRSLIVYDEPITLYPFPMSVGTRVTTSGRASNAELLGLPVALEDVYDVEVTGRGELRLPDLILHNTLRVTLRFERTLVVGDARQVTHVFVHECLGEVARVVSEVKPLGSTLDDEFETASAIWRLSL